MQGSNKREKVTKGCKGFASGGRQLLVVMGGASWGKRSWGSTRAGWLVAGSNPLCCWRENGREIGSLSSFYLFCE